VPPLENGDVLTRAEFERRYEAMPHLKKAELIEGVAYVPSPVRHRYHDHQHTRWLDPAALLRGDLATVLTVVQRGLASPEHAAFATRLHPPSATV